MSRSFEESTHWARLLFTLALIALGLLIARTGSAVGLQVDVIPNFVGIGFGVTTEWLGAKDEVSGIAPGARVALENNRFVEVYGPFADVNVLDDPNREFGPAVSYRFGRKDVTDPVVNQLPSIDGGFEGGLFAGWHYTNIEGIPFRVRLGITTTTGITGDATGSHVTPFASLWVPLSPTIFVGMGGGITWSSASFMQQRFGVSTEASATSGLPVYSAGAGVRQYYLWPAVMFRVAPHWYIGVGGFYQRLTGDAANSPIVTQRGARDQITAGAGIGYAW